MSSPALAMTRPNGSARNEPPQNSRPPPGGPFVADPVDGRDVDAVGDGVRPLDGLPGTRLGRAELGLLGRVPADRRGIEEDLGPLRAVSRAASGYHWSQQTRVPTRAIRRVERLETRGRRA